MPPPEFLNDPERDGIEDALRSLSPSGRRLDRDRLMFEAGRASAERPRRARLWPAVAAGLAAVAIGEAGLLATRPGPRVVERLVVIRPPAAGSDATEEPAPPEPVPAAVADVRPEPPLAPTTDPSPAELRRRVLRYGVDALPEPPPLVLRAAAADPSPAASVRRLRSELLQTLNPGEPS